MKLETIEQRRDRINRQFARNINWREERRQFWERKSESKLHPFGTSDGVGF